MGYTQLELLSLDLMADYKRRQEDPHIPDDRNIDDRNDYLLTVGRFEQRHAGFAKLRYGLTCCYIFDCSEGAEQYDLQRARIAGERGLAIAETGGAEPMRWFFTEMYRQRSFK